MKVYIQITCWLASIWHSEYLTPGLKLETSKVYAEVEYEIKPFLWCAHIFYYINKIKKCAVQDIKSIKCNSFVLTSEDEKKHTV